MSDTSYRAHFGHGHSSRTIRPQMIGGCNRFQYRGYWFGFNQGWPVGPSYDDTVYVELVDRAYTTKVSWHRSFQPSGKKGLHQAYLFHGHRGSRLYRKLGAYTL